jgi:hypothetical protein
MSPIVSRAAGAVLTSVGAVKAGAWNMREDTLMDEHDDDLTSEVTEGAEEETERFTGDCRRSRGAG